MNPASGTALSFPAWAPLVWLLGLGLMALGVRLFWRARRASPDQNPGQSPAEQADMGARSRSMTRASSMTAGLVAVILGYHALAWTVPDRWAPLKVPLARWWLLVAGSGAALGVSWWTDRLEGREPEDGPTEN